ncbi:hypothetical protein M758_UG081100 [Ceratodon purpureus]|nr:hypothetical protein M758_UG081100 [Ceratodon purpureus]
MPALEECELVRAFYKDMPVLESGEPDDNCINQAHLFENVGIHNSSWSPFTRARDLCAKVLLLQLVCQVFHVPSPVLSDSIDVILSLYLWGTLFPLNRRLERLSDGMRTWCSTDVVERIV